MMLCRLAVADPDLQLTWVGGDAFEDLTISMKVEFSEDNSGSSKKMCYLYHSISGCSLLLSGKRTQWGLFIQATGLKEKFTPEWPFIFFTPIKSLYKNMLFTKISASNER